MPRARAAARSGRQNRDTPWARHFLVSYHPSAVLRAENDVAGATLLAALVEDLKRASQLLRDAA